MENKLKALEVTNPAQANTPESAGSADIITCPNCFGSGTDLDGFNEICECGLCHGAEKLDRNDLPEEWKAWA